MTQVEIRNGGRYLIYWAAVAAAIYLGGICHYLGEIAKNTKEISQCSPKERTE